MDIHEVSIYLAVIVCATEIVVCEIQREIQLAEREGFTGTGEKVEGE